MYSLLSFWDRISHYVAHLIRNLLHCQGYLTLSTGITKTGSSAEVFKNTFDLLLVKCWILLIVGLCLCLIHPTSKPGLLWILKYRILPQACEESAGRMETRTPHKIWKMMRANVCSSDEFKTNVFRASVSCVLFNSYLDPLPWTGPSLAINLNFDPSW